MQFSQHILEINHPTAGNSATTVWIRKRLKIKLKPSSLPTSAKFPLLICSMTTVISMEAVDEARKSNYFLFLFSRDILFIDLTF